MEKCFVALGANLGNPAQHVQMAYELIANHCDVYEPLCSPLYQTAPVSSIDQPDFVNAVCTFETTLALYPLFHFLNTVERLLGKTAKAKDAPRPIDLDLIFYGEHHHASDDLTVPHPEWDKRSFVLRPLADLTDAFGVHDKLETVEDVCLSQLSPALVS